MGWIGELSCGNFLVQVLVILTSEWELAAEHGKEKNAAGPYISWWSNVLSLHDYLWAHVRGRSTEDFQLNVW